jgi:phospholipid/cholesterol/gamma-HCH transport system ATP-binding protein
MGVLVELIKRLNDILGLTSVLVSHDVDESLAIADYVYLLAEGRLIAEGTPQQLRDSDSPAVRQFIDARADGPVPFHYPGPGFAEELYKES